MIEALYLHVPFCVKRCAYCDFPTRACSDDALMDAYVDALSLAVRRASKAGLLGGIKTIYLGGGTPSFLGSRRLNSLVYLLSLSINLENVEEFTVECNPDSLDAAMVKDLFALGVNRFSIGAQSFDDAVLSTYGRAHTAVQIDEAVTCVKERTGNFSLDLICGGPGQDMRSWTDSVQRAIDSGAAHVSIYPLMLEEGTPLCRAVEADELSAPDDDAQAEMMLVAGELLEAAGMHRYEVASYAHPGHESRHNTAYWTGVEYLGLGAGASSMLSPESYAACCDAQLFGAAHELGDAGVPACVGEGCARVRLTADFDIEAYAQTLGRPAAGMECLDAHEALLEDAMLGMRRSVGLSDAFVERVAAVEPRIVQVLSQLEGEGLVVHEAERWAPTQRGWLLGNEVYGAIWGLA